jgi:hypothetical protein
MDGVAGEDVWPAELEHTFHHMRDSGADDGTDGQHSHSERVAHTEGELCVIVSRTSLCCRSVRQSHEPLGEKCSALFICPSLFVVQSCTCVVFSTPNVF